MAKLARDYKSQKDKYLTIPYFFRIGNIGFSNEEFLKEGLLSVIERELGKKIKSEIADNFDDIVKKLVLVVSEGLGEVSEKTGKKILLFIDGMDEKCRYGFHFLDIIGEICSKTGNARVVWLIAGRNEKYLEDKIKALKNKANVMEPEFLFPSGLSPLDEESIRLIFYKSFERLKYRMMEKDRFENDIYTNEFLQIIQKKSKGLPLFIKMLVEDIKKGNWKLDKLNDLPEGLENYYKRLLSQIQVSDVGTILTPILCFLALAKKPLTEKELNFLLSENEIKKLKTRLIIN